MSYHRGEPYVWSDDTDMHLWSNRREGETGWHSAVPIDLAVFDEIVVKRFLVLAEEGRVPPAIQGAMRKMGGKAEEEMLKAARGKR